MRSLTFFLIVLIISCDTLTDYDEPNVLRQGCDLIEINLDAFPITLNGVQIFRAEITIDSLFDFSESLHVFTDGATLDTIANGTFTSKSIIIEAYNYSAEFLYLPNSSINVDIDLTVKLNSYFCSEVHEAFASVPEEPDFIVIQPSTFAPALTDTLKVTGKLIDENNLQISNDQRFELYVLDTFSLPNTRFWNQKIAFSKDSKVEFKILKLDTIPERIKVVASDASRILVSDTLFIVFQN